LMGLGFARLEESRLLCSFGSGWRAIIRVEIGCRHPIPGRDRVSPPDSG
jgi:hypothetical protein